MTTELAKDAFTKQNFLLAYEIYETSLLRRCSSNSNRSTMRNINNNSYNNKSCIGDTNLELFYGYGDSLAKLGRLKESFDVYAHICQQLYGIVPVDRLKCLAISLIEQIKSLLVTTWRSNNNSNKYINNTTIFSDNNDNDDESNVNRNPIDPLLCSICEDILKYPVTSICGHTFCRQCCFGRTECFVCGHNFFSNSSSSSNTTTTTTTTPTDIVIASSSSTSSSCFVSNYNCANNDIYTHTSFEQDVLIRRLVEKWWEPELRATELNDEAQRHLENNSLDEALKCCNKSLEYGKCYI